MDTKCAACGKTVYPLEQLKCLDRIWHKFCFKCVVCGMTLSMKNYKGLEKKPYCNAHYPQPKAYTFVADSQEVQRVKQNTAVISNVKYHEQYEKSKGTRATVSESAPAAAGGVSGVAYAGRQATHQRQHVTSSSAGTAPAWQQQQLQQQLQQQNSNHELPKSQSSDATRGTCYRAVFAYTANDDDEVTFAEGDIITNGDPIDDGWMYGVVEKTGQYGMLPSNYVERI